MTHPKPNLLPLSENLRFLLEALTTETGNTDWVTAGIWARAERLGYVEDGDVLTDFGRLVLDVDQSHGLHLTNRVLGQSPIAGGGRIYGSAGRCTCKERWENNETPAKGGHKRIKEQHRAHVHTVLVERVAREAGRLSTAGQVTAAAELLRKV